MKRTIRILSVCLAVSLLCATCLYAAPASSDGNIADKMSDAISEIESPLTISKERMERESAALIQYNDLIKGMQSITKLEDIYPESYGGAYIDDNGDLVVCITESADRASATEMVKTLTKNPDIETKTVKYSLNSLRQTKERISNAYATAVKQSDTALTEKQSYSNFLSDILSICITQKNNAIIVSIKELNNKKIEDFKRFFPTIDCVFFENCATATFTATSWHPGRAIYTPTGALSTGYPVWFTDSNGAVKRGFITAGHAFYESTYAFISQTINTSNALAYRVSYQCSNNVDAALMEIVNDNYEISNITRYGGITLYPDAYATPDNATVYKEGFVSYVTSGQIVSTEGELHALLDPNDPTSMVTITDLYETTAVSLPGDSGGPMYTYVHGTPYIIGSMSGSLFIGTTPSEESFYRSYACKITNAINALGFWISE